MAYQDNFANPHAYRPPMADQMSRALAAKTTPAAIFAIRAFLTMKADTDMTTVDLDAIKISILWGSKRIRQRYDEGGHNRDGYGSSMGREARGNRGPRSPRTDHEADICVGPVDVCGFIPICSMCKQKDCVLPDCRNRGDDLEDEELHFNVYIRHGKSMVVGFRETQDISQPGTTVDSVDSDQGSLYSSAG
ncbi:hypothetical protein IFR05_010447 [Cadophora sp. M221]|nr:hypothetical protein IFR05_010447 [Cadophora sp. M221]